MLRYGHGQLPSSKDLLRFGHERTAQPRNKERTCFVRLWRRTPTPRPAHILLLLRNFHRCLGLFMSRPDGLAQEQIADVLRESSGSAAIGSHPIAASSVLTGCASRSLQLGATPLHRAAGAGQLAAAEVLIRDGKAKVNVRDKHGETPLFLAAASGHQEVGAGREREAGLFDFCFNDFSGSLLRFDSFGFDRSQIHRRHLLLCAPVYFSFPLMRGRFSWTALMRRVGRPD